MGQHQKHVQHLEADGGHREESTETRVLAKVNAERQSRQTHDRTTQNRRSGGVNFGAGRNASER